MRREFLLFSDASFDPHLDVGAGAILILAGEGGQLKTSREDMVIKTRITESKSIARLEILTALWALEELKETEVGLTAENSTLSLFTDCRAIENLLSRRAKLEAGNYQSKAKSQTLTNADLYQKFFTVYDELPFTITWVKGHSPSQNQTGIQRVFSHVDKAAREKLRQYRDQKN